MKSKIFFLTCLSVLLCTNAYAGQFQFDFRKSIFSNKYKFIIYNQDDSRALSFSGCYVKSATETDYYVQLKNGKKYYLDSRVFCQIGMKGSYWINSGEKGIIPFKISKDVMLNAENIVLKGITFIPVRSGGFLETKDVREIVVTYDIQTNRMSFQISDEVIDQQPYDFSDDLDAGLDGDFESIELGDLNGVFDKGIEIEEFRLRD
jgi:hypothetical protein